MSRNCPVQMVAASSDNRGGGHHDMLKPDEVNVMKTLWQKGWRIKQIVREVGHGKNTVRRFVRAFEAGLGGPSKASLPPGRPRCLAGVAPDWLKEHLIRHRGNADVIRQELASTLGIKVSLRTVERAVRGFRQEIRAEVLATIRFETAPGKQIQVDFGTKVVEIGGVRTKVHLCVLTLGYSRRIYVQPFRGEKQAQWFAGIEGAFHHFGGVTEDILVDNARALVDTNDGAGNVKFNAGFKSFCDHWGIKPKACRPYRARTKGKDERAVGYVKHNALAGRSFASWDELEAHLQWWMRDVADCRVHQTVNEEPIKRFEKERDFLLPLGGHKPFMVTRAATRTVKTDATVDFFGNSYSVPYRLLGKSVDVAAQDGKVEVIADGKLVACHAAVADGAGMRVIEPEHLKGVMRLWGASKTEAAAAAQGGERRVVGDSSLLRSLAEYEVFFNGSSALAAGGAL